jgi:hypothetical protein
MRACVREFAGMHVCVRACVRARRCACVRVRVCVRARARASERASVSVRVRARARARMRVRVRACVLVCARACTQRQQHAPSEPATGVTGKGTSQPHRQHAAGAFEGELAWAKDVSLKE